MLLLKLTALSTSEELTKRQKRSASIATLLTFGPRLPQKLDPFNLGTQLRFCDLF